MAEIRLQPPDPFNFKVPDDWPRWRRRFEQFRVASGLKEASASKQVNTLLYCLGEEAESVLKSTNITDDERKEYDTVLGKFDNFFQLRRNVIFERARFNRRCQLPGESAEQYIVELYNLAEHCNYGELKSEMIRDRLVVGILDKKLSEHLQLDPDLTLEVAKKKIRQREAVQEQQQMLGGAVSNSLEEVKQTHFRSRKARENGKPQHKQGRKNANQNQSDLKSCSRCGKKHPKEKCPAKEAICRRCQRKGHYSAYCFTKLEEITAPEESNLDSAFLNTLEDKTDASWTVQIKLNGQNTVFKLDTGAEVSAVTQETYRNLGIQLSKPQKMLHGPSQTPLQVTGQFQGKLEYKGKETLQSVYVVNHLKRNLLGLPAITALNLAVRVESMTNTTCSVVGKFPSLFQGLGSFGEEYTIKLKAGAKPFAIFTPRNVPMPLRTRVKQELDKMESMRVISKIEEPTPWCAGMVVVPKKTGTIRICVDLKPLNENVQREVHPLPTVDDTLAQLTGATIFSTLDANSGFWQVPLEQSSRLLTTFLTPYGRYCFNKMPFGICSAPEHFQRQMEKILRGLQGVLCHMDDVVIFGHTKEEHDARLEIALRCIEAAGVTLNPTKCQFGKTEIKFLGHLISEKGIQPDPDKTAAIAKMPRPTSVQELKRFMGMVNHLGKFSRNLAELSQPLRALLSKNNLWTWDSAQDQAFARIKEEITKPTVLALYDVKADTKISADASSYGLGAVLLQKNNQLWQPVIYASRTMTSTECRYAHVEKEALASTWACEKFANYVLGKKFTIETDHKPLVPLLGNKSLHSLPPRILRFRLRLTRFEYEIIHVPGKSLVMADTLSRAPIRHSDTDTSDLQEEAEYLMEMCINSLPANSHRLEDFCKAQAADIICSTIISYCQNEWPKKPNIPLEIKPYWQARGQLTVHNNLLLYGPRIVIPTALQKEILSKIHEGHQGIQKCRLRANTSVWWPGISKHINDLIEQCPTCVKEHTPGKEPLIPTDLPDYPWQKIGTDLFFMNGSNYLVAVDYFSRYFETIKLKSTTSGSIIEGLKSFFSRYGIPEIVVSDNGPQYSSREFAEFAASYQFQHTTSSPLFPQSNGQAERTVQTAKRLLKNAKDPYMALLTYRSTPLAWCNLSPAELFMGRCLRTTLPQVNDQLIPQWKYLETFRKQNKEFKQRQKSAYDRRHRTSSLPPIADDTKVWITSGRTALPGQIMSHANTPRSYIVNTPGGQIRRNRQHLNVIPDKSNDNQLPSNSNSETSALPGPLTRSRTGTDIRPPDRLRY